MPTNTVYLALGGNLGAVELTFSSAEAAIGSTIGNVEARSSTYQTYSLIAPGKIDPIAPQYRNAVLRVRSELSATEVLYNILKIEQSLGRNRAREERWGPRTIDIDLLMYGQEIIDLPGLKVPHPELHKRDFVLKPLSEVGSEALHPLQKKTIGELWTECQSTEHTKTIIRN